LIFKRIFIYWNHVIRYSVYVGMVFILVELNISSKLLEIWRKEDEEARRIRKKYADWKYIEKQPTRIKAALLYFIEKGDRYVAAKIAGITVEEFDEIRRRANIPVVV